MTTHTLKPLSPITSNELTKESAKAPKQSLKGHVISSCGRDHSVFILGILTKTDLDIVLAFIHYDTLIKNIRLLE